MKEPGFGRAFFVLSLAAARHLAFVACTAHLKAT
jgi:hypothetical protein